jgi:hypothetical protein
VLRILIETVCMFGVSDHSAVAPRALTRVKAAITMRISQSSPEVFAQQAIPVERVFALL